MWSISNLPICTRRRSTFTWLFERSTQRWPPTNALGATLVTWEKIESSIPPWASMLYHSRLARLAVLLPTTLSALAGLDDIGTWATWLVKCWEPIREKVATFVKPLSIPLDLTPDTLATLLFFLPFVAYAIASRLGKNYEQPRWYIEVLAIGSCILLFMATIGASLDTSNISMWASVSFLAICTYAIVAMINWLTIRNRIISILAPALGNIVLCIAMIEDERNPIYIATVLCVFILPLLAPRRLAETGILFTVILAISLAHEWVSSIHMLPA